MIKNYIFDFGWVLVRFDSNYMTGKYITNKDDLKLAKDVIFDRLYWDRLDNGTITDDEVKKAICKRLPKNLHLNACKAYDNWYYNLPPIEGMLDLVKEIKSNGGKLYLLSNISIGFAENYKSVPEINELFSLFDGLVFSAPLKITKPQKEIFDYLLNKYNLKATESMFIDDSEKNVKGAAAAGITGILFDGNAQDLRKQLLL